MVFLASAERTAATKAAAASAGGEDGETGADDDAVTPVRMASLSLEAHNHQRWHRPEEGGSLPPRNRIESQRAMTFRRGWWWR